MKWGAVKKARQRIKRLGFKNKAVRLFEETEKTIKGMKISRKEKTALMEKNAERFLRSGMGTKTEIMESFQMEIFDYPEKLQQMINDLTGGDVSDMARYVEATENQKYEMEARHYVPSDIIQMLAEAVGAGTINTEQFYQYMHEAAMFSYMNEGKKTPDEIQEYIMELI